MKFSFCLLASSQDRIQLLTQTEKATLEKRKQMIFFIYYLPGTIFVLFNSFHTWNTGSWPQLYITTT